jgi:hypothetical protein
LVVPVQYNNVIPSLTDQYEWYLLLISIGSSILLRVQEIQVFIIGGSILRPGRGFNVKFFPRGLVGGKGYYHPYNFVRQGDNPFTPPLDPPGFIIYGRSG